MAPAQLLMIVAVCGATVGVSAASVQNCHRKTCMGNEYDTCEAVCCENRLHQGEGLSCCGGEPYNKEEDTCCKAGGNLEVTMGSEKVSQCCGRKAYNQVNEICCKGKVVAKPAVNALCCDDVAYDMDKQMCCGSLQDGMVVLTRISKDHLCCKNNTYDTKTECCCETQQGLIVKSRNSENCDDSVRCGEVTYNKFHQLCCNLTVQSKSGSNIECCGRQTYDKDTQLCCSDKYLILQRRSRDHLCCGVNQFDKETERCCSGTKGLQVQPISSSCEESGEQEQRPAAQVNCPGPHAQLCGSSCYNPTWQSCCRPKSNSQWCLSPGRCAGAPTVYDPHTHICCDGCVSEKPRIEPHDTPAQHFCGTEPYHPQDQMCCHGHRHPRTENRHCCGVKAYNIKDTRLKCCAGRLHNVTVRHEARCCGSILLTPSSVCCASADMEVLYSAKPRFSCCGHHYFNTSLWSCCLGTLSPVQHPGQHSQSVPESGPMSVNNLREEELCGEINIGTVESVSHQSIVFINVLKINGRKGTVTPLASPHVLETRHGCHATKLIPGKSYFFKRVHVFTDFNLNSVLHFLNFVISKCYLPTANAT